MTYAFHAYIQQAPKERFEELALAFAKDVLQPDAAAEVRLKTGHVDFLRVHPDGATIKISQVRAFIGTLSARPYEGGRRAVVFFHADKMSTQAQNCLLKTLEEPPIGTAFLLLSERPSNLLPTIRSRCAMLQPFKEQEDDVSLAKDLLSALKASDPMSAASTLPQERADLLTRCTGLLDSLDALMRTAAKNRDQSVVRYSRYIHTVHHAQQMLEHNVNAALCAQWLCIQLKEDNHDNGRWSKV